MARNDDTLQAAYGRAVTDILIRTHEAFEKNSDLVQSMRLNEWYDALELVFAPVMQCPLLTDDSNLIWFSAWVRNAKDTPLFLPLPKECQEHQGARQVIATYAHIGWSDSTSTLSQVAALCGAKDRAFIFWTGTHDEDPLELLASPQLKPMLVGIDASPIDAAFGDRLNKERKELFDAPAILPERVIVMQNERFRAIASEQYAALRSTLYDQVVACWTETGISDIEVHKRLNEMVLNKLINYYCWVRIAYGDTSAWRVMLYLPGVMAKTEEGVPYGVNIGMKTMPSVETAMFLTRAALTFFTRLSVDWFEYQRTREILTHGKRAAIAAIMSRNMSHNIGSHVLSFIDQDSLGDAARMATLHGYLQRRMDLVARLTVQHPGWGEPLWFFADLLQGFLSQDILLNHLIKDQGGWQKGTLAFVLHKGGYERRISHRTEDGWKEGLREAVRDPNFGDFLVSIPDGNIGAQAFYVMLESLMRNSAKYGRVKQNPEILEIHLELRDCEDYHAIAVWDNLSICSQREDNGEKLCVEMQGKLREALIDKRGNLSSRSLGIAEMREACAFLIYPFGDRYPVYPQSSSGASSGGGCEQCSNAQMNGERQNEANETFPLWTTCHDYNGEEYLKYTFHLAKPQLIGVVGDRIDIPIEAKRFGIAKLGDKKILETRAGAFQFALLLVTDDNVKEILAWIESAHFYLPQRLLLVQGGHTNDVHGITPERRAVTCTLADLGLDISQGGLDWEAVALRVYVTWLRKRWGHESVVLHVSFHRSSIPAGWYRKGACDLLGFCCVKVWSRNGKGKRIMETSIGDETRTDAPVHVHYANHGGWQIDGVTLATVVAFAEGDKTFEAIWSPPTAVFAFTYFILGLIEAALAKVVVVDERAALWACIEGKEENFARLTACQAARTWPIFKFQNDQEYWLTDYLKKCVSTWPTNPFVPTWFLQDPSGAAEDVICESPQNAGTQPAPISNTDFIVMHIGVLETVGKRLPLDHDIIDIAGGHAPSVIVTSGRGGAADQRSGLHRPFIEYAAVGDCLINDVAKYHLVRVLMSTKGTKVPEN